MKCFNCNDGLMRTRISKIESEVRGERIRVEVEAEVCDHCGAKVLSDEQTDAYTIVSADAYRRRHRLLTTAELKATRKALGMTQVEFAEFLKVGRASVKRWEAGLVQDAAMDELMRLKTNVEAALANLRQLEARIGEKPVAAQRKPSRLYGRQTVAASGSNAPGSRVRLDPD